MTALSRWIQADVHELVGRGRQELSKWLDRLEPRSGRRVVRARRGPAPVGARPGFAGLDDADPGELFARRFPETRRAVLARAESVHDRRFDLLGYRGLSFGDPVDWHLDPLSGRRSDLARWSDLDPLDVQRCGDVKVVWELNRHQWLVHLAQAYRWTAEERHAEAAVALLHEWMRANPPGLGINWTSSLELALRLIAWCWVLRLLAPARALDRDVEREIVDWLALHAGHVQRYLSSYSSPNTHLTAEALGLFYAGALHGELEGAERWRRLGAQILTHEIERQVLDDGVYFEQSTCYQRYTADIYLHFLILARRCGVPVPDRVPQRVQRLLDFLLAVRSPDGTLPRIGDADGGALLPLAPRGPEDVRGTFAVAAAWFGRPDYAWAAGGPAPELFWLLGRAGLAAFDALAPAAPGGAPSRAFAHGGYVVMRSSWEPDAHQLVFDVGPLGCPISAGHGHADLLSVQCAPFGEPHLVDPGTDSYAANPRWRDAFRETSVHSTVVVDGRSQARPSGPFQWRDRPRARLRCWQSGAQFDYADAEHDAYARLDPPVRHRRRVVFVKPRYWVLVDDLQGAGVHRLELRFQFGPVEVDRIDAPWVAARASSRAGLALGAFATSGLAPDVRLGLDDPIEGWIAPDYGARRPAPLVVYELSTALPARLVSVLWPLRRAGEVHPAAALSARTSGLQLQCGFDVLDIGDELLQLCTAGTTLELG